MNGFYLNRGFSREEETRRNSQMPSIDVRASERSGREPAVFLCANFLRFQPFDNIR